MMLFFRLALFAGFLIFTQAILLPPSPSSADTDIINTLPPEVISGATGRTLDLECEKCPVPVKPQDRLEWLYDVKSKLQLHFEVVENSDDVLQLNGIQIYPSIDFLLEPLGAPQITQDTIADNYTAFVRLGHELNITPIMRSEDDQLELILIRLQVIEVAGIFVDGLDSVLLKLIKSSTGKLMIGDVETGSTTNPGGRNCQTLICELKSFLASKLSHPRGPKSGCGRKAASENGYSHDHGHSRQGTGHGVHRHHRHHGILRVLHALKKAAIHVLFPILIGIAAGFTASFLGMLVGQSAVFLWRRFYRRDRRGSYFMVEQTESDPDKADQEKSALEHQDSPPLYEDIIENVKAAD